jgi:hypothetical protein
MTVGSKRRIIVPPKLGPPVGPSTFFSAKQCEVRSPSRAAAAAAPLAAPGPQPDLPLLQPCCSAPHSPPPSPHPTHAPTPLPTHPQVFDIELRAIRVCRQESAMMFSRVVCE